MVYYIHMVNSFLHAGPVYVLLDAYVLFDSEEYMKFLEHFVEVKKIISN